MTPQAVFLDRDGALNERTERREVVGADTGRDPIAFISRAISLSAPVPSIEIIWTSPREVLNVVQVSLDTVRMFREDALKAGFSLSGQAQPT